MWSLSAFTVARAKKCARWWCSPTTTSSDTPKIRNSSVAREQVNMQIEGCIIDFDEYMNLVLDDAEETHSNTKSRKHLGHIMLKGGNITLLQSVSN